MNNEVGCVTKQLQSLRCRCICQRSTNHTNNWTLTRIMLLFVWINHIQHFIYILTFCYIKALKHNTTQFWKYGKIIPRSIANQMRPHTLAFICLLVFWLDYPRNTNMLEYNNFNNNRSFPMVSITVSLR